MTVAVRVFPLTPKASVAPTPGAPAAVLEPRPQWQHAEVVKVIAETPDTMTLRLLSVNPAGSCPVSTTTRAWRWQARPRPVPRFLLGRLVAFPRRSSHRPGRYPTSLSGPTSSEHCRAVTGSRGRPCPTSHLDRTGVRAVPVVGAGRNPCRLWPSFATRPTWLSPGWRARRPASSRRLLHVDPSPLAETCAWSEVARTFTWDRHGAPGAAQPRRAGHAGRSRRRSAPPAGGRMPAV